MKLERRDQERDVLVDIPEGRNLFDAVGWIGLLNLVWRATPFPLRLVALPYGVAVYRRLLIDSDSVACLFILHSRKYRDSLVFRICRPRYRKVHRLLRATPRYTELARPRRAPTEGRYDPGPWQAAPDVLT
jgi:hypothetical protein